MQEIKPQWVLKLSVFLKSRWSRNAKKIGCQKFNLKVLWIRHKSFSIYSFSIYSENISPPSEVAMKSSLTWSGAP